MTDKSDTEKTVPNIAAGSGWNPGIQRPANPDDPTVVDPTFRTKSSMPSAGSKRAVVADDDEKTKIFTAPAPGANVDPSKLPVGWVVITQGPGRGTAYQLCYGSNRIGRGPGVEVSLNFDDASISRGAHTRIAYDTKGRMFYLAPGDGTGLTYRKGQPEPILTPVPLEPNTEIEIGHTVLRFLPLCSKDFDWMDSLDESKK